MYAIVEVGGKQERVALGNTLAVEKLDGEPGTEVTLDKVLLCVNGDDVQVGTPYLAGATVTATIAQQTKAKKLYVYKFRAKSRYRRKQGHRQLETHLAIKAINV